nr:MAG TPA: hypothetical protein [Caudoviricetes sp.]
MCGGFFVRFFLFKPRKGAFFFAFFFQLASIFADLLIFIYIKKII